VTGVVPVGKEAIHWEGGARPMAEIRVEDSGSGISPEDLARIYEPFFSTKGNRGTGLGLAVTWGIIESHQGTIDVQSEVGKGTQFTVRLPLAQGAQSPDPT
jgi:two-component system, NtrC family, sensor kinase